MRNHPNWNRQTVADDDIPKPRDQPVDRGRGSITGSDVNMSSDEESNLCDRLVMESETEWDSQDSQDPSYTEYCANVNLQARQAMTVNDDTLSDDNYPDIVKNIVRKARMSMRAWDEHDALPVEQQTGCEMPSCQCNGHVEFMVRGSEDMTETDDSEWEDPADRDNRSYVMSNNYNLQRGWLLGHIPLPYGRTDAGGMRFGRNTKRTLKIILVTLVMREAGPVRTLPVQNNRYNRL